VDEPLAVCERQPARIWIANSSAAAAGGPSLDQALQILALDVLEDDELPAFVLAAIDPGACSDAKGRDGARLAPEPLDVRLVGPQCSWSTFSATLRSSNRSCAR
jgi:hypothetical protein